MRPLPKSRDLRLNDPVWDVKRAAVHLLLVSCVIQASKRPNFSVFGIIVCNGATSFLLLELWPLQAV